MKKKFTINKRKILFIAVITAMLFIIIPFGIKAFAQKNVNVDIENDSNSKCTINVFNDFSTVNFVKDFDDSGLFVDENSVVEFSVNDGIGYLYLTPPSSTNKQLIASAYPKRGYKFTKWEVKEPEVAFLKLNEQYIIESDVTFNAKTVNVDAQKEGGTIQGRLLHEISADPVSDVTVYFKPLNSQTEYKCHSDVNGYYRLSGIPLDVPGAVNYLKADYVVDYSDTIILSTKSQKGSFIDLGTNTLTKGVTINLYSNSSEKPFHIWKYYMSLTKEMEPHLAEEFYVNFIEDERLSIDGLLRIMPDNECDEYGFRHNTLCYSYVYTGIVGGTKYFGYIEPSEDADVDCWRYSTNKVNNAKIPKTDKDEESIVLVKEDGPYDLQLNYVLLDPPSPPVPPEPISPEADTNPTPVDSNNSSVGGIVQTGDNSFMPLCILACFLLSAIILVCNNRMVKHF